MPFVVEEATEQKRLIDVKTMKTIRFPRLGDRCLITTGFVTGFPIKKEKITACIIDIDPSRELLRFKGSDTKIYETAIDDYLNKWWYELSTDF